MPSLTSAEPKLKSAWTHGSDGPMVKFNVFPDHRGSPWIRAVRESDDFPYFVFAVTVMSQDQFRKMASQIPTWAYPENLAVGSVTAEVYYARLGHVMAAGRVHEMLKETRSDR